MQYYDKALVSFGVVHEADRKMVPELENCICHRKHIAGSNTDGWGGVKIKNLLVDEIGRWLHRKALVVKTQMTAKLI